MADDEPMDVAWMTELTTQVILATVDDQPERAIDLIDEAGQRYGWPGAYALYCALAEAAAKMGEHELTRDGDFLGFEVIDQKTGDNIAPEAASGAEDMVVAMRFVVAHVNRDTAQKLALFQSALTPTEAALLPIGLLKLIRVYGQHRLEQSRGGIDA